LAAVDQEQAAAQPEAATGLIQSSAPLLLLVAVVAGQIVHLQPETTAGQVVAAALVMPLVEQEILRQSVHHKETTAAPEIATTLHTPTVAAGVVLLLLVQMQQIPTVETAATVQHLAFLAEVLLMLAVAAVALKVAELLERAGQEAVVLGLLEIPRQPLEPPTQAAVVAVLRVAQAPYRQQAAPVSSSSNTTSALPRSLPSSPRRTGLHRLVRSALTTSL
jgi:hypothetical protein